MSAVPSMPSMPSGSPNGDQRDEQHVEQRPELPTEQHPEQPSEGMSIDHLSPEAIAALVDGELGRRAEHRAKIHLVHCKYCRDEVNAQRQAAHRLRGLATDVHASGTLIERLRRIPDQAVADSPRDKFSADGCRRPESISDAVDLMIRKLGRRSGSKP